MSEADVRQHGIEAFLEGAESAGEARVDIRVRRDAGFVNLRLDAGQAAGAVTGILGQELPGAANTFTDGERRVYWLGPDEWLVATRAGDAAELSARLGELAKKLHLAVNDLSGGYVSLRLAGDDARTVLAKGCTLDLHPGVFEPGLCAQTGLARASVLLAAIDDTPSFELVVRRSFADYLCRWLAHSARAHGVRFSTWQD